MTDAAFDSTKKCPHCGQWSSWQQQTGDLCTHCGQPLDPQRLAGEAARREQEARPAAPGLTLIEINPEDGLLLSCLKYVVRGGQLAFAAILAFLVWLVTALAA